MMKGVFPTALLIAGLALTPAAFAGTQDNISSCRAALTEQGQLNMDDYRLRFQSKKGSSKVTLNLLAIPTSADAEKVKVTCVVKRGKVLSVGVQK